MQFPQAWTKLSRAYKHMVSLQADIRAFLNTKPYAIEREFDAESQMNVLRARVFAEPPVDMALTVGDIAHNLRTIYDYLVHALVIANRYRPTKATMFPVTETAPDFAEVAKRRLKGIPACGFALVERLQPYNAGDGARKHALKVLNDLDVMDKHRNLHVVGCGIYGWEMHVGAAGQNLSVDELSLSDISRCPLKDRAELIRYSIHAADTDGANLGDVDVEGNITFGVALAHLEDVRLGAVEPLLKRLIDYTAEVIREFERLPVA